MALAMDYSCCDLIAQPLSSKVGIEQLTAAFVACRGRALAMATHIMADAEEAADVVQEAYERAQQHLPSFRGDASLAGWLLRIVVNLALKRLRRHKLQQRLLHFIPGYGAVSAPAAEWLAGANEEVRQLGQALASLPAKQRAAFVLRHAHDLSVEEVAQAMNVSVATVKTHLLRAMRGLRRSMKGVRP